MRKSGFPLGIPTETALGIFASQKQCFRVGLNHPHTPKRTALVRRVLYRDIAKAMWRQNMNLWYNKIYVRIF